MSDLISRSEAVQRLIQETVDSKNNLIHINTVKRLLQYVDLSGRYTCRYWFFHYISMATASRTI